MSTPSKWLAESGLEKNSTPTAVWVSKQIPQPFKGFQCWAISHLTVSQLCKYLDKNPDYLNI